MHIDALSVEPPTPNKLLLCGCYHDVLGLSTLEGSHAVAISAANRPSPKTGRNFDVFWAGDPLKVNLKALNPPKKAQVRNKTRRLSY